MSKNPGFGKRVKAQRVQLGASRKLLADLTRIDLWWLERIEVGQLDESHLTKDELTRLADVLQCTQDWLVYGGQSAAALLGVGIIANRSRSKGVQQQELALAERRCPHCHHLVTGARRDRCGHPDC